MQLVADDFTGRGTSFQCADQVKGLPLLAPWCGASNTTILPAALFALFGTEMKVALSKVIADLDWPKPGPPIAERKKEIAKLDKEIAKIDTSLEKLNTIARQAGIQLTGIAVAKKGNKALPGEIRLGKGINTGA